jgi:hypothetical protein
MLVYFVKSKELAGTIEVPQRVGGGLEDEESSKPWSFGAALLYQD